MSNDNKQSIAAMPDITNDTESGSGTALNWVGMSRIELPVMLRNSSGQTFQSLASVQAYVNIAKPEVKGIHMSRLYLLLDQKLGMAELTPALLQEVVAEFIVSQEGISDSAFIECKLDYFERRASLKSDNTGWKNYPLRLQASSRKGVVSTELELEIPYSSTCPCSAALARQLIQQSFEDKFGAEGQVEAKDVSTWLRTPKGTSATPHSQRSIAQVRLRLQDDAAFAITPLIDAVEDALQTPVQTAVKREDEQEFARLNAANLMFCEDAARRIHAALDSKGNINDFWVRVNHLESLHPHDAVAVVTKGIEGGFDDAPLDYIP